MKLAAASLLYVPPPALSRTHLRIPILLGAAEQEPRAAVQQPSRLLKQLCSSRTAANL